MMTDGGGGSNGILAVLEEVISCALISSHTLCCTVYWPANRVLRWLSLGKESVYVCVLFRGFPGKVRDHSVTAHAYSQAAGQTHTHTRWRAMFYGQRAFMEWAAASLVSSV